MSPAAAAALVSALNPNDLDGLDKNGAESIMVGGMSVKLAPQTNFLNRAFALREFRRLDPENTGMVEAKKLSEFLGEKFGESMDSDGDGLVTEEQFVVLYRAFFAVRYIAEKMKVGKIDKLPRPLVLAHRGVPGLNPAHSLQGYYEAVDSGADYIEYDCNSTKDGRLIICHDVTLEGETDVAEKFPERKAKNRIESAVDGDPLEMEGWFAKDFTLEEILTLNKAEPDFARVTGRERAAATKQGVLSVEEASRKLEERRQQCLKESNGERNFGLIIELKRAEWHRETLKLPLEEQLLKELDDSGFAGPIIIQCFEEGALRRIKALRPQYQYMKLLIDQPTCEEVGIPTSHGLPGIDAPVEELRAFLKQIAQYANIVSPWKVSLVPRPEYHPIRSDTIEICHELGMEVMPYTFRTDVHFLHQAYGGNATEEYARFFRLGVDGVFTDFTGHARHARDAFYMYGAEEMTFIPNSRTMTAATKMASGKFSDGINLMKSSTRRANQTLIGERKMAKLI